MQSNDDTSSPSSITNIADLARRGDLMELKKAVEEGYPLPQYIPKGIDDVDILEYLVSCGCQWRNDSLMEYLFDRKSSCFSFALESGAPGNITPEDFNRYYYTGNF